VHSTTRHGGRRSTGIVATAAFKHDGADRVTIVGEDVGDRLRWWSEGHSVCMPHSQYCCEATDGLWDLVKGCAGQTGRYGDRLDATVGSLAPDLPAPLTASAWLAGRDPAMAAVERSLAAGAILDRAARAIGLERGVPGFGIVVTAATCEGPGGAFETGVVSAPDGRMRFEQVAEGRHAVKGITDGRAWQFDPDAGRNEAVDDVTKAFLKGHELHMLALAPQTRLRAPQSTGEREFNGERVQIVEFRDDLDAPVAMYYSSTTGLPVGMRNVNHTGRGERDVYVRFGDWERIGGVLLFRCAAFTQGTDEYRYRYTEVDLYADEGRLYPPGKAGAQ
jgi:hypothetical protein